MTRVFAGNLDGDSLRIGIAISSFNAAVTDGLFAGAMAALEESSVSDITVVRVPGSLELPAAAQKLVRAGMDTVIAIGAVIEGETDHYTHVAGQTMEGLQRVALDSGVPVANAVLTVREYAHARDRSLPGKANKGYEAAQAAVITANAFRELAGDGG
jgi:6,7-dimethyl-8-ribityllumazine synthase